jgi:hypothetical protein
MLQIYFKTGAVSATGLLSTGKQNTYATTACYKIKITMKTGTET